jgi:phage shock protein PspC (stress-responsive transcriptional regulator)
MILAMETPTGTPTLEAPPAPTAGPAGRRLHRSGDDRVIAGVAGGIAATYDLDPLLVRLAFVVAAFFGGIGVVAYLVAWIVLPRPEPSDAPARRADPRQLLGLGLVALGLAVLPGSFGFGFEGGAAFWPVALVAIGGAVLWLRARDLRDAPAAPDPDPLRPAPPATPSAPPAPAPAPAPPESAPPVPPARPAQRAPKPRRERRPRSPLAGVTLSALLVLAGGAWLVDVAGLVDVDIAVVVALGLALVGVALVTSAWWGRARGLIALGIVLALAVAAFGLIDVPLRGGIGDPVYRPRSPAALQHSYRLAIGELTLDLRELDLTGDARRVLAQVGIGEMHVRVPADTRVVVDGHAGIGTVNTFRRSTHECCPTNVRRVRPGLPGAGTLRIRADVGVGTIEITD